MGKYWKNAEITNGRLAMIGFLALIINYGFFGWIIPGFIQAVNTSKIKEEINLSFETNSPFLKKILSRGKEIVHTQNHESSQKRKKNYKHFEYEPIT